MKTRTRQRNRREGASASRSQWRHKLWAWLRHHRLSAADSLNRILDKPFASILTWLVLGIALALPVGLSVALDNVARLSANWDSATQISLFLRQDVSTAQAQTLQQQLDGRDDIASTRLLSRADALAEFSALSGFADVLGNLEENPLPNLLLVVPADISDQATAALRQQLAALPAVSEAVLDMAWLQRLNSLMLLSRRLVLAVGGLLILGVVLILGNTIRLSIENRRDEITIVKLVGGSNAFVRRPFLYTGLWYGVGGGVFAALLVALALWFLGTPVADLAALYDSSFRLRGPGLIGALNLVVIGGMLGLGGAWLAVTRHLSEIEPR